MASFDPDKCHRRNSYAANFGAVSAPVQLFRESPEPERLESRPSVLLASQGSLPRTDADALTLINALLPANADPLTAEQVFVHYCEAANGSFVGDRFLFLDTTTLKNIKQCAEEGVAFMNSHATGGMSHPAELPFGKTFCARYEKYTNAQGQPSERTIVGFYMLAKGHDGGPVYPNGPTAPSTADLDASIRGGTLFDVSVGLWGGEELCSVCGNDLYASDTQGRYLCPHIPGTHVGMTTADIAVQKERGVPNGECASVLCNARMGEVSAVYDGAVTGAGFRYQHLAAGSTAPLFAGAVHGTAFRKARAFAKRGDLDDGALSACKRTFARLGADTFDRYAGKRASAAETNTEALAASTAALAEQVEAQTAATTISGDPLTGQPFDAQIDAALTACRGVLDRATRLAETRTSQGRALPLSAERHAQLTAFYGEFGRLLEATRPGPSPELTASRLRAQRLRAACLSAEIN